MSESPVDRAAMKRKLVSAFAVSPHILGVGEIVVPCGPGRICATIEYDADGPVLDSQYKREEYALAMEERLGGPWSDDAYAAYSRRALHMMGVDSNA
jgi:hypothetical protein